MHFGNYLKLIKKSSPRFAIDYFMNAHLYDIKRGTNTHLYFEKDKEIDTRKSLSFKDGISYFVSWTSTVKKSLNFLIQLLGEDFKNFQFIDAGCGKGKPCLVYSELMENLNLEERIFPIGLDYSESMINLAKRNASIMHEKNLITFEKLPKYYYAEAIDYDKYSDSNKLIFYIYNPFIGLTLDNFIKKIMSQNCFIIYCNPVEIEKFQKYNFKIIKNFYGYNLRENISIISNNNFFKN